jgi:hypothetical protein
MKVRIAPIRVAVWAAATGANAADARHSATQINFLLIFRPPVTTCLNEKLGDRALSAASS